VREIGAALPDVEVSTSWGAMALKVRGQMFVCVATHKSAEPDTLVVRMDIDQRNALIEEEPSVYYLKEHYVNYPCVLVRLTRVSPEALRDLVHTAYRYVGATVRRRVPRSRRTGVAGQARVRVNRG
jgi:hypothetical protein